MICNQQKNNCCPILIRLIELYSITLLFIDTNIHFLCCMIKKLLAYRYISKDNKRHSLLDASKITLMFKSAKVGQWSWQLVC